MILTLKLQFLNKNCFVIVHVKSCVLLLTERWCLSPPLGLCQVDIYIQPVDTRQSSF